MLVIGLTGNIASGKSTVARVWRSLGAVVLDADEIGHEILCAGSDALKRAVDEFGEDILTDGALDREKLANRTFNDGEAVKRLNALVHPLIRREIRKRMEEERAAGSPVVVIDAALIYEAGSEEDYDVIVVVHAPLEKRLLWLSQQRGVDKERALMVERRQMDPEEKAGRGDYLLENVGDVEALKNEARALFKKILETRKGEKKGVDAGF